MVNRPPLLPDTSPSGCKELSALDSALSTLNKPRELTNVTLLPPHISVSIRVPSLQPPTVISRINKTLSGRRERNRLPAAPPRPTVGVADAGFLRGLGLGSSLRTFSSPGFTQHLAWVPPGQSGKHGEFSPGGSACQTRLQVRCTSVTLAAIPNSLLSSNELAVLDADPRSQPPESHQSDIE